MKKSLALAALVAAGLMGPGVPTLAAPPDMQSERSEVPKLSSEDFAALTDARVAALKAGLKLSPEQEKNWPAVEAAIREGGKACAARFEEWRKLRLEGDADHRNVIERMQWRAKAMQERATRLAALATAAKPLYDSLDEGQKTRFGMLLHATEPHHGHWRHSAEN
jgi:hypothetical protein